MTGAPPPSLRELREQNAVVLYGLTGSDLDDIDEAQLTWVTRSLQTFLRSDYAGVHILDGGFQVMLASSDSDEPSAVPRSDSVCAAVLADHEDAALIEVPDATLDAAIKDNVFVDGTRGNLRFYAAAPLRTREGVVLGTLCVTGHEPRRLDTAERHLLLHLGYAVSFLLDAHRRAARG